MPWPAQNGSIADDLMGVLGTGRSLGRYPGSGCPRPTVLRPRSAHGGGPRRAGVGRKIGFTNTTIWPIYGVSAPMWNYVYDRRCTTSQRWPTGSTSADWRSRASSRRSCSASGRPRSRDDRRRASRMRRLGGARVRARAVGLSRLGADRAESAAAFGLHGALLIGPRHPIGDDREAWAPGCRTSRSPSAGTARRWPRARAPTPSAGRSRPCAS